MKKQAGFTLIEIMIALLIGLVIVTATITIYVSTIKGSTDTINSARLNHDLESVMSLMVNDIRRAGYWGGAVVGADSSTNPFTIGTANIQIPTAACILYSYDADGDGSPDNGESYGFKLQSEAVKIRSADTAETTVDCTGTGWSTLTVEESVNITALTFSTAYKCLDVSAVPLPPAVSVTFNDACAIAVPTGTLPGHKLVESRQINIVLTGQLVNDPAVKKTLFGTVKVRNDRICIQGSNC
jgi:type IV pilus assembly protein PilW